MKMNETLACKLSIMRKLYGKSLVEFAEESCKQKSIAEMKKVPQNLHS